MCQPLLVRAACWMVGVLLIVIRMLLSKKIPYDKFEKAFWIIMIIVSVGYSARCVYYGVHPTLLTETVSLIDYEAVRHKSGLEFSVVDGNGERKELYVPLEFVRDLNKTDSIQKQKIYQITYETHENIVTEVRA